MPESSAWLLKLSKNDAIAIGEQELIHIITEPELLKIPKTMPHCQHIINWKNNVLPVMNILGLLHNQNTDISNIIGIIAYKDPRSMSIQYSAIDLSFIPKKIIVNDNQACELSTTEEKWSQYTIASFKQQQKVIPIVDLARLFST